MFLSKVNEQYYKKICQNLPLTSCQNQHFHRLDVISVYYLEFSELFNPQMKKKQLPQNMLKLMFAVGQILIQIFEISFPLGTTSQKKIIELSEKEFC